MKQKGAAFENKTLRIYMGCYTIINWNTDGADK